MDIDIRGREGAMVRVEEAQKGKFVDALGAKLAASFASPGPAAPKHERARFTAVARAAIERCVSLRRRLSACPYPCPCCERPRHRPAASSFQHQARAGTVSQQPCSSCCC